MRSGVCGFVVAVLVGVASMVFVVSGCATVPITGPVRHSELGSGETDAGIQIPPVTPQPGFTPQQIVNGFIEAMAQDSQNQNGARRFLSSRVRDTWSPSTVTIIEGHSLQPIGTREDRLAFSATQTGEIRSDGSWVARSGEYEKKFQLVKEKGEWRIDNPSNTLLRSRTLLSTGFASYNVFFFDANSEILVPDPVYLATGKGIETRLVKALLRGPTTWLRPVVRTSVPSGLRLAGTAVAVDDGVATVDLDESFLEASDSVREEVAAQLAWTLAQVGVEAVRITVKSRPVGVGSEGAERFTPPARYDPALSTASEQPYAIEDGTIVRVDDATLAQVGGVELPDGATPDAVVPALQTTGRRLDPDGIPREPTDRLAVVVGNGEELWLFSPSSRPTEPSYTDTGIRTPSWDRTGKLWFVEDTGTGSGLRVIDEGGEVQSVSAPDLADKHVTALRVSRDGVRAAMLIDEGDRTTLWVGRIDRSQGLAVEGLRPLRIGLRTMTDLAWSDIDQITVVGNAEGDRPQIIQIPVDGSEPQELRVSQSVVWIAAAPGQPILISGGDDHRIYVQDASTEYGWSRLGNARSPAYPG